MKHCIEQGYCSCVTGNCIVIQFKKLEAQLAVKTKLINNIKTCCSIRSVTAFLDHYEQTLGNDTEQDNE